jgi:shikimate kinase
MSRCEDGPDDRPGDDTSADSRAASLIFIGPPGSGKTTVGRLVASRLGVDFVDTDQLIEAEQRCTISDIFIERGEPAFRELEADAVARVAERPGVVAVGGGAPMTAATAELLVDHAVVFLDVGIADAAGRVGFDQSRPLLAVNPRATWTRLMGQRRPTYERLARWVVNTAGRTPAQVADEVLAVAGLQECAQHG